VLPESRLTLLHPALQCIVQTRQKLVVKNVKALAYASQVVGRVTFSVAKVYNNVSQKPQQRLIGRWRAVHSI